MDTKCPIRPLLQVGESRFVRNKCLGPPCEWFIEEEANYDGEGTCSLRMIALNLQRASLALEKLSNKA